MLRFINIGENTFIPSYNLFVGIGIAIAMLYLQYQKLFKEKRENEKFKIHLSLIISIIFGFIGSFILDAFTQKIPITFDNLNKIGLTFFGGLISGSLILFLSLKFFSLPVITNLNILTIPFCIAHFFGRIGCFMTGCCFGSPTNSIFGVVFPKDSLPYNHYHEFIKIHPTQLYESAFVLLLLFFLTKFKIKNQFFIYVISYSIFRFFIEFIRADNRGIVLHQNLFSPSQIISILTVIFFTSLIFINKNLHTQTIKL